ncbi:hypothetical protein R3P38DRAFT_3284403 [Favolaschia claudopus]|uniref:Uncharacterized protein n=1 Tax=Favolaschia claudopus TaxID=2862362 RepID=A0AAW0A7E7_9AGAR
MPSLSNRGSTGEIGEAAAKTASNFGTVPMAVTIVSVVLLVLAIVAGMYKYNEKHSWKRADETEAKALAGNDADSPGNPEPTPPAASSPTSAQVAAEGGASERVMNSENTEKPEKPEKQNQKLRWFIGFEK